MNSVSQIVENSFADFWSQFTSFIPTLLLALALLFAGFILAWLLEIVSRRIMKFVMLDKIVEKIGLKGLFDKAGLKVSFTRLLSGIVYWFVLIVFLTSVIDVLGLTQLSSFMDGLVAYLPNVIAAVAILVIGILVANLLFNVVKHASESANLQSASFLASLTKWSIFVFSFIAALVQLKIAPDLLTVLFTGIIVMISLAGGLAFGLGGKDAAKEIIEKFRGNIRSN
ncbi:MAG: mechanosensitive ion channel family protein [Candidatus Kerfeldbacteria bacterium]|jgi:small-conductance mechanosensitive channel